MRIVIAGGSGFLGSALARSLAHDGHQVIVLTRSLPPGPPRDHPREPGLFSAGWAPDGPAGAWASVLDAADAVVNLAGESIAGGRWTAARKGRIRDSRIASTRSLVEAICAAERPPAAFVSGSAVGYYGSRGNEILTEDSAAGGDFLAGVCVAWEREAARAASQRTRVAVVRTGLVLGREGGALPLMALPFRLFAGGRVGSGEQYLAWIHRTDWTALVRRILENPTISGPVNATAPTPVTNARFSAALAGALHRPNWLPGPAFGLRLALGEMADALLLASQRAIPKRAVESGFGFRHPEIEEALNDIFPTP